MAKKKKFYLSDMVDGTGRGLRKSWDAVSGNWMKNKAGGEKLHPGLVPLGTFGGGVAGMSAGLVILMSTRDGDLALTTVIGATALGTVVPIAGNHMDGAYKLSKYNKQKDIEHEKRLQIENKTKLPPGAKLT